MNQAFYKFPGRIKDRRLKPCIVPNMSSWISDNYKGVKTALELFFAKSNYDTQNLPRNCLSRPSNMSKSKVGMLKIIKNEFKLISYCSLFAIYFIDFILFYLPRHCNCGHFDAFQYVREKEF